MVRRACDLVNAVPASCRESRGKKRHILAACAAIFTTFPQYHHRSNRHSGIVSRPSPFRIEIHSPRTLVFHSSFYPHFHWLPPSSSHLFLLCDSSFFLSRLQYSRCYTFNMSAVAKKPNNKPKVAPSTHLIAGGIAGFAEACLCHREFFLESLSSTEGC